MTRMPHAVVPAWNTTMPGELTSEWWDEINESQQWQDGIFFTLSALFAAVSSVALIQLIRIELRVPEFGWTTQKVFHFMNFLVNGVRSVVFGFHKHVFLLQPKVLTLALLDFPGLLFFSTYTLLALFWAEIYHQARNLPTKHRIYYASINGGIYFIQICIWVYLWIDDNSVVEFAGKIFIAVVSFIAALGFLFYGGRLFGMLRRFPIESKGRRKKLHEHISCYLSRIKRSIFLLLCALIPGITDHLLAFYSWNQVGYVTAICFTCFFIRCFVVVLSAFDSDASLDVLDHPVLNLIYYLLVEILPSALVLYILRKLPPKKTPTTQYHPIR